MNAIIPLNIAALRVNLNDQSKVVGNFLGRVAAFDKIPTEKGASTGDTVVNLLSDRSGPANPLDVGVHLHWELPDYFRKGIHSQEKGGIVFPHAPNRWLVTRYLRYRLQEGGDWKTVGPMQWVVESDFISPNLIADRDGTLRPAVPVPLPTSESKPRPWQFMGRVVEAKDWKPGGNPQDYLSAYKGADEKPYYLTSIGFLGPGFASYYPDCCSVFGFWDRFQDEKTLYDAIQNNLPHELRVSYSVMGWVDAEGQDPFDTAPAEVRKAHDDYVRRCKEKGVAPERTPVDFFLDHARTRLGWEFHQNNFLFSLQPDGSLKEIHLPQKSICAGTMQEIGWTMLQNPGSISFLDTMPESTVPGVGKDKVKLAVGNTPLEALSALAAENAANPDQMEVMLNAMQLGLLENLEEQPDAVELLEEGLHSAAFSRKQGGKWWMVRQREGRNIDKGEPVTLPVELAKKLDAVNEAQKKYDVSRAGLFRMRRQLFMEWFRYIKIITRSNGESNEHENALISFISDTESGQLKKVTDAAKESGLLAYIQDPESGSVVDIGRPTEEKSLAFRVWEAFQVLKSALTDYPQWGVVASSAAPFWNPSEPTLLMEGKRMEPTRRNGTASLVTIRLSQELIHQVVFELGGKSYPVLASSLNGVPTLPETMPMREDLENLLREFALVLPHYAPQVVAELAKQGFPPANDQAQAVQAVQQIQGGSFPWDDKQKGGLFGAIRQLGYQPVMNPVAEISSPIVLKATFTNTAQQGYAPHSIAWNAQRGLQEFNANRRDPYLPVSLIWEVAFESLSRTEGFNYAGKVITQSFQMDQDSVDLRYELKGEKPAFATNQAVPYRMAIELSQKPAFSLTTQIDAYQRNHPQNMSKDALDTLRQNFVDRNIMAQAMNGFSIMQELGNPIAQIPVQNLVMTRRADPLTPEIHKTAIAIPQDNWYHSGFNGAAPISSGLLAQINFGPLRAGFMQVKEMEVVDVFGQRFILQTEQTVPGGFLHTRAARSMRPHPQDKVNAGKVYLPPRVLAPTRTWFRWMSASYDNTPKKALQSKQPDSAIPTTSPICGWLVPNHLEDSLAFYDADGRPIGSFAVENSQLRYRTRAGNLENPTDDLELDLVKDRKPIVNIYAAEFMRYIHGQSPAFFNALSQSILESDAHIQPPNFQDDISLSVLVGRPLAISRAMFSLETEGGLLPISQASVNKDYPWPQDIHAPKEEGRRDYVERQKFSAAQLQGVQFPVRLGDISNVADGLVAFLPEAKDGSRYDVLYSAYAPQNGQTKVRMPQSDTLTATLNGEIKFLTFLHDPRAAVHVTTGILPVEELSIPSQQYSEALQNLQVTFTTWPVLQQSNQFIVPLPIQKGFAWSWVSPGKPEDIPLAENASNGNATWGYGQQTAVEGWLKLSQVPPEPPKPEQ